MQVELGLDTFGDTTLGPDGRLKPHDEVLREVVEQGVLADELGIHFLGIGEHHRADFSVSAPEIVLAAIAARTSRIRLGSAVTVLSSDDPIRVFQRFSTLNAISNGRAEVILGRGSFTESFPLFGYELEDYEMLFEEKLDLFAHLIRDDAVTWSGQTRPPLVNQRVYPTLGPGLQVWVGVGGDPRRFKPYVDLYHRACAQMGRTVKPVGIHSPGHIAATDELAAEQLWPHYKAMFDRIGAERGWPPVTPDRFMGEITHGSLYVGSPETVARKIANAITALGVTRFDMKYSTGPMPHKQLCDSLRLYGEKVIPMVKDMVAGVQIAAQ